MFFAGDIYAGTGVVVDPAHPPELADDLEETARILRRKSFSEYFSRVFAPYYLKRQPASTSASLIKDNRLDIIAAALRDDGDYYAQTNSDDLILDQRELAWLKNTLGSTHRGLRSRRPRRQLGRALPDRGHARHARRALERVGAMIAAAVLALIATALCGCASQQLSIRSLPPTLPRPTRRQPPKARPPWPQPSTSMRRAAQPTRRPSRRRTPRRCSPTNTN